MQIIDLSTCSAVVVAFMPLTPHRVDGGRSMIAAQKRSVCRLNALSTVAVAGRHLAPKPRRLSNSVLHFCDRLNASARSTTDRVGGIFGASFPEGLKTDSSLALRDGRNW